MPSLANTLLYALGCFGLAWVIADSKISLPIRVWIMAKTGEGPLLMLLECPPCLSFWIGLFTGIFLLHLGFISIPFAFVCVAISLLLWTFAGSSR